MRVLLVNTSDKIGGAAVAASRLMHALQGEGVDVKMLVRDRVEQSADIISLQTGLFASQKAFMRKALERLTLLPSLNWKRDNLWAIDNGACGYDITKLKEFQEADVIHLHWVNQGMLSLNDIRRILKTGKKVVWTMHDLWPASSICHYSDGCTGFHDGCHHCPMLPGGGSKNDLSAHVWRKKEKCYSVGKITFVACSHWLEQQALQSGLTQQHIVTSIPNPIDSNVFCKKDKLAARDSLHLPKNKKIILLVSQKVTDERKGATFFIEAVNRLAHKSKDFAHNTAVAILGGHSKDIAEQIGVEAFSLGYVKDTQKIVDIYNAADCFCLPSLQDNLPNTIMEAMACGVPCVGFDIGGVPEMIDHKLNGFVATPRNIQELADGLCYCLADENASVLSAECIKKIREYYSEQVVARKFIEFYK